MHRYVEFSQRNRLPSLALSCSLKLWWGHLGATEGVQAAAALYTECRWPWCFGERECWDPSMSQTQKVINMEAKIKISYLTNSGNRMFSCTNLSMPSSFIISPFSRSHPSFRSFSALRTTRRNHRGHRSRGHRTQNGGPDWWTDRPLGRPAPITGWV